MTQYLRFSLRVLIHLGNSHFQGAQLVFRILNQPLPPLELLPSVIFAGSAFPAGGEPLQAAPGRPDLRHPGAGAAAPRGGAGEGEAPARLGEGVPRRLQAEPGGGGDGLMGGLLQAKKRGEGGGGRGGKEGYLLTGILA